MGLVGATLLEQNDKWAVQRSHDITLESTVQIESLNGKLRDECLSQEIFSSLKEAQIVIGLWQSTYDRVRPPSSLGYRPPAPISYPDLALRLPVAATVQSPLNRRGPKYRSGQDSRKEEWQMAFLDNSFSSGKNERDHFDADAFALEHS